MIPSSSSSFPSFFLMYIMGLYHSLTFGAETITSIMSSTWPFSGGGKPLNQLLADDIGVIPDHQLTPEASHFLAAVEAMEEEGRQIGGARILREREYAEWFQNHINGFVLGGPHAVPLPPAYL